MAARDASTCLLSLVGALLVLLMLFSAPVVGQGEGMCGYGEYNATSGLCVCPSTAYGDLCQLELIHVDRTRCLVDYETGPGFCFSLLPQPCTGGTAVGITEHQTTDMALVGAQVFLDSAVTEQVICSDVVEAGDCTSCLSLTNIAFTQSTVSATARVQKNCGGETVLDIDVGTVVESSSACGFSGTKYPAVCGTELASYTETDQLTVDDDLCLMREGQIIFCPVVLIDTCGYEAAVLLSGAGYAFEAHLAEGETDISCLDDDTCLSVTRVSYSSSSSVSIDFIVRLQDAEISYTGLTAVAAQCGTERYCPNLTSDNGSDLFWEVVGAAVMMVVCMALVAGSIVVVMWRKRNGDPSGYGSMSGDTTDGSLIDELADAEPTSDDD